MKKWQPGKLVELGKLSELLKIFKWLYIELFVKYIERSNHYISGFYFGVLPSGFE